MSTKLFEVTGEQHGRWYVCRHNSATRRVNHTQFLVLLELLLAAFDHPNRWLPLKIMRAAGGNPETGRTYMKRLRDELRARGLIETDCHGNYRLNIALENIRLGPTLWKLQAGEADPDVITRLYRAYVAWLDSHL